VRTSRASSNNGEIWTFKTVFNRQVARNHINDLTNIETQGQSVTFGGSVKDFDVADYLKPKEIKKMDAFKHRRYCAYQSCKQ
jgi:hypothetical protein